MLAIWHTIEKVVRTEAFTKYKTVTCTEILLVTDATRLVHITLLLRHPIAAASPSDSYCFVVQDMALSTADSRHGELRKVCEQG